MNVNDAIPALDFITTDSHKANFTDLAGKKIVLYFYPKDDTPGCTQEGKDFAALYPEFLHHNAIVLGVSRDDLKAHHKFKEKYCFPFPLIADENEALCQQFAVIKMKNMYGKQVRGIERSTFLIDQQGIIRQVWRGVKVDGHVAEVLEAVKKL